MEFLLNLYWWWWFCLVSRILQIGMIINWLDIISHCLVHVHNDPLSRSYDNNISLNVDSHLWNPHLYYFHLIPNRLRSTLWLCVCLSILFRLCYYYLNNYSVLIVVVQICQLPREWEMNGICCLCSRSVKCHKLCHIITPIPPGDRMESLDRTNVRIKCR